MSRDMTNAQTTDARKQLTNTAPNAIEKQIRLIFKNFSINRKSMIDTDVDIGLI